jgi:hypothetical protein
VFAGPFVGVGEIEEQVWMASLLDYDSGFFDTEEGGMPAKSVRAGQAVNHAPGIRQEWACAASLIPIKLFGVPRRRY